MNEPAPSQVDADAGNPPPGPTVVEATRSYRAPSDDYPDTPPLPDIPGYEVMGVLGRGGMGMVYKAQHIKLKRVVALKMVLSGTHASPEELQRFRIEAEVVARLQHPNIVQIHEIGDYDAKPYFSLEFVAGGSLAKKLAGNPQPPCEAAEVVETLARAMQAAHQLDIVHRDLKPGNVLLSEDGTPKVADFGLAKQFDGEQAQTKTGAILGTPSYMAPEQAEGKTRQIGPLSDVYALGAILYEMLTGRPPFKGATILDTLEQVRTQEPVPPSRLQPKVPRDLETICLKCLAKSPAGRYATAEALAEDLRRFLAGEPILARPVGTVERLWRWCRRKPALAAAGSAALLAGLIALVTFAVAFFLVRQSRDEAVEAATEKDRQLHRANELLYLAEMPLAQRAWESGTLPQMRAILARHVPAPDQPDPRGWEWYYLDALSRSHVAQLRGDNSNVLSLNWGPTGRKVLAAHQNGAVEVWDVDTGKLAASPTAKGGFSAAGAWSPDGRWWAVGKDTDPIEVWDAAENKKVRQLTRSLGATGKPSRLQSLAWSRDSRWLAAGDWAGDVALYDHDAVAPTRTLKNQLVLTPQNPVQCVAFSPDGKRLAASQDCVRLWDPADGKLLRSFPSAQRGPVTAVAWSPDGQWLVSSAHDHKILVWDADRATIVTTLNATEDRILGVTWGPGRLVASVSFWGKLRIWDALDGYEILAAPGGTLGVWSVAWSPDGSRLATGGIDGLIRVWTITDWLKAQRIALWRGLEPTLGPDGVQLAAFSQDKTAVLICDAISGKERLRFPAPQGPDPQGPVGKLAWSPDGQWLAVTAGGTPDGSTLEVWDVANRKKTLARTYPKQTIVSLAWNRQGRLAVGFSREDVEVLELTARHEPVTLPGTATALAWSSDGRSLAIGHRAVRLWDVQSREKIGEFDGHNDQVLAIAFSPDGKRLASAARDQTVRLWELGTSSAPLVLHGHTKAVRAVAWHPDGRRIASAGEDAVRLWDTSLGQEVLTLSVPGVSQVAWSADGRQLLALMPERIIIWSLQ